MTNDILDLKQLGLGHLDCGRAILIVSVTIASLMFAMGLMAAFEAISSPGEWTDLLFLGLMILSGPYGLYRSYQMKRVRDFERQLPMFLRDVAEAGRFGMTLPEAIRAASRGRYGSLTPEIQRMAAQLDWGIPVSDAMQMFAERVDTPLVRRMISVMIKANEAGGNVADVLTMVADDARRTIHDRNERSVNMSTYTVIIYVAFAVFLITIFILNTSFLPKMMEAGSQLEGVTGITGTPGSIMSIRTGIVPTIQTLLVLSVMVHAFGDGLLAGVLQNGHISNGLRHSFILLVIGFVGTRLIG